MQLHNLEAWAIQRLCKVWVHFALFAHETIKYINFLLLLLLMFIRRHFAIKGTNSISKRVFHFLVYSYKLKYPFLLIEKRIFTFKKFFRLKIWALLFQGKNFGIAHCHVFDCCLIVMT